MMGHLLCGLIVGWLAAGVSFWIGHSVGSMLGIYALGASLGYAISLLWSLGVRGGTNWITRWPALDKQARRNL